MKRLQNKIAESRFALPVVAVYTAAMWLAGGIIARQQYVEFALFAVSAYLMAEMNNRNALIRIYSRMVSCSFLVFGTMAWSASNLQTSATLDTWLVQLCFIAAYLTLFSCYQDKRAQGKMFYAFMFIGVASTLFVQALFSYRCCGCSSAQPHGVQRAQLLGIAYRPDPAILVLRRILRPDRPD